MATEPPSRTALTGGLFALAAAVTWAAFPIYWRLLAGVPATEVLLHRIVWSAVFAGLMLLPGGRWRHALAVAGQPRRLAVLAVTALLIGGNWLVFIWAVNAGRVLDASLGYFLNPLVNVALGMLFLRERLTRGQAAGMVLALLGVTALGLAQGVAPWVALALALSFGFYGLLRKMAPIDPLVGMAIETWLLAPPALAALLWLGGGGHFGTRDRATDLLLMAGGVVSTLPLVWFAAGAKRLRYTTMGFFQFICPIGQFLLAVLAYGEPLTTTHLLTFGCIWAALAVITAETVMRSRRPRTPPR